VKFPRDVDVGPDGVFYVVDRTATVHRIAADGRLLASLPMPDGERGNPQGLSVTDDGRILVADTHYNRVVILSPEGKCLTTFGRFGEGPGEFIYPTAAVLSPRGRLVVAEYGGNDRIQVFTESGEYLYGFGGYGEEPGAFRRPSGLCFGTDGLLYVSDACNHRIQVFTEAGEWIRSIGGFGRKTGRLHYPFDVAWSPGGTLLVVEYGNHRVQEFSPDGDSLRTRGGPGARPGELHNPWGIAAGPFGVVVADSWNERLQVWSRRWDGGASVSSPPRTRAEGLAGR
jgi:DNA-binding beta-propeller fold protein YncE